MSMMMRVRMRRAPAMAGACVLLALAAASVVLMFVPSVPHVAEVARALLAFAAAVTVVLVARRCAVAIRLPWQLLGASVALWGVAQAGYGVSGLFGEPHVIGRWAPGELCVLAAAAVAMTGYVLLARRGLHPELGRLRTALDVATIVTSASLIVWVSLLSPMVQQQQLGLVAVHTFAYPAYDIVAVTVATLLAAYAPAHQRLSMTLLASGVLAFSTTDMFVIDAMASGVAHVGGIATLGWIAGLVLVAAGAVAAAAPMPPNTRSAHWRPLLVPYVLLGPLCVIGVVSTARGTALDTFAVVLGSAMLVAILARQLVTLGENMRLVGQMSGQEAELRHQAEHDALTGLANRRLFRERLESAVAALSPDDVAVVFVDLDDFKVVNDTMGHATGDDLLRKMANRLQACVRTSDLAARLGGDEFAVLLTQGGLGAAQAVATRLTRAMRQPMVIDGQPIFVQASVGIAAGGEELGREPGQLLEQADMAMYAAKEAGKARLAVFEPDMRERLLDRAAVKEDLHRALSRGQLHLHYQPIVDLSTGTVTGAEALLRWQHPQRGNIPPLTFIPLAEETGLINRIGRWALQVACTEAVSWQAPGRPVHINVNFSAGQLLNADVVAEVGAILAETELPPELLTIEMTESVLMNDNDDVGAQLAALRGLGVRIAIDDFGTGYSGLNYLDRLPVDILKIDKAFVDKLSTPGERQPLARVVVGLARMLELGVVAEGIEDDAQRSALVAMGCTEGQGYFFSPPVPPERLREMMRAGRTDVPEQSAPAVPAAAVAPQRSPAAADATADR